jgi:SAM-dependent methyltransferase
MISESKSNADAPESSAGQAGKPRGIGGVVMGLLMGWLNAQMNRSAVEILEIKPDDHLLEIGFGPGQLIELIVNAGAARVAGMDHSATMLKSATRRNSAAIARRKVDLRAGSVGKLPWPDASFDKAVAVNSFQFWPEPMHDLVEVARVLKLGGTLLLVIRGRKAGSNSRYAGADRGEEHLARALQVLPGAGFIDISHETRATWPAPSICVRAHKK